MNMDCIFCGIVKGEIKSTILHEDENIIVINDIHPVKKVHMLFITKKHIEDYTSLDDSSILISLKNASQKYIDEMGLMGKGYKLTVNGGGAQDINHLHFHLIGPLGQHAKLV